MSLAVIGGGLTGCLVALELAERGQDVAIFDREDALMLRASLANEGKIHLGYVYSADASFRTAETLIDDALQFRPLLERWISSAAFAACLTESFHYIIPPDSALPPERILLHFRRVEAHLQRQEQRLNLSYLGGREGDGCDTGHSCEVTGGIWVKSFEKAVRPAGIAELIRACVKAHPKIQIFPNRQVHRAEPVCGKWRIVFDDPSLPPDGPYDTVINAAWAGRRGIDRQSGFAASDAWFTRFKFGVLLGNAAKALGSDLPLNTTATLGRFGDSVYYPQDDSLYCSWYPTGMCYTSRDDATNFGLKTQPEPETLMRQTWQGYASIDPAYRKLAALPAPLGGRLVGDFIVAAAASDIDDPASQLHKRAVHGPRELAPGYWSIDTGKYTSAPRCAADCADAIAGAAQICLRS